MSAECNHGATIASFLVGGKEGEVTYLLTCFIFTLCFFPMGTHRGFTSLLSSAFYPHNNPVKKVRLRASDWPKISTQTSMAEWGSRSGSYYDTLEGPLNSAMLEIFVVTSPFHKHAQGMGFDLCADRGTRNPGHVSYGRNVHKAKVKSSFMRIGQFCSAKAKQCLIF